MFIFLKLFGYCLQTQTLESSVYSRQSRYQTDGAHATPSLCCCLFISSEWKCVGSSQDVSFAVRLELLSNLVQLRAMKLVSENDFVVKGPIRNNLLHLGLADFFDQIQRQKFHIGDVTRLFLKFPALNDEIRKTMKNNHALTQDHFFAQ